MSNSITFNHEEKGDNEDLMSAALMVEGGDKEEEEGGPPQDGMAYLRQVMRERKRVPETVTAEIKPKKQKPDVAGGQKSAGSGGGDLGDLGDLNSRTKVPPPPGCSPGAGWQREQVARFMVPLAWQEGKQFRSEPGGFMLYLFFLF